MPKTITWNGISASLWRLLLSPCPYSPSSSSPALNSFLVSPLSPLLCTRERDFFSKGKKSDRKTLMASKLHLSFRDCVCRLESHTNQGNHSSPHSFLLRERESFSCSPAEASAAAAAAAAVSISHPTNTSDGNFQDQCLFSQTANSIFHSFEVIILRGKISMYFCFSSLTISSLAIDFGREFSRDKQRSIECKSNERKISQVVLYPSTR